MTPRLADRKSERLELERLAAAVRAGHSRALVLHGEAGVGKTALLDYLAASASDCRVLRAGGVQTEMELAFAALHQLSAPVLDRADRLPGPQRDALLTAFGMSAGPPPDRFLVGLATLGLLSEVAAEGPLLCLVDDLQWVDLATAQVLAFVARRLGTESVGMVFGTRVPGDDVSGLPELLVEGLPEADARKLLEVALPGPVDERVRSQILAETRGNPLALLELPRSLTAVELAGGFGVLGALRLPTGIEDGFRRRLDALPADTRRLLALAAAEPVGDSVLIWRAAGRLGIAPEAAEPAAEAGLAEFGLHARFRHPVVRLVAYRSVSAAERRQVHAALADVTDAEADPDRRAWHRAQAAAGPDEEVAAELERSAGRAQARGGLAAAGAFLERAAILSVDPARRAERALAAARAKVQAGAFTGALDLLAMAGTGPPAESRLVRADLLRAQVAYYTNRGNDASPELLNAARRLESIDVGLSRATYVEALSASMFAGRLAGPGGSALDVSRAVAAAPNAGNVGGTSSTGNAKTLADLLLHGFTTHFTQGYAAGLTSLREATASFTDEIPVDEQLRVLFLANVAALHAWDDEGWLAVATRYARLAREAGSLTELPLALTMRAHLHCFHGELEAAASLYGELQAVADAAGTHVTAYSALFYAAMRGTDAAASALIESGTRDATMRGEGVGLGVIDWAEALLSNGLGDYERAVTAARRIPEFDLGVYNWVLPELIEAAARSQQADVAADALGRLSEQTEAAGTDWARGIEARSRALLAPDQSAERLYRRAIEYLGRTRMRADLARAHLLYGEWLRRDRRRAEAREELRAAHLMLQEMGMGGFAERARHELLATGETARKRTGVADDRQLTPQEAQIARLARDGLSNPEIGARLFISARTVQYHLGKVFSKLDIGSRAELWQALAGDLADDSA